MARFRRTTTKKEEKGDGATKQARTSGRTNKDDQEAADLVNAAIGHVVPPSASPDDNITVNMDDDDRPKRKRGRPTSASTSAGPRKRQKTEPSTATVSSTAPRNSTEAASATSAQQTLGKLPTPSKQPTKRPTRPLRTSRKASSPPRSSVPELTSRRKRIQQSADPTPDDPTPAPEPVEASTPSAESPTADKDYEAENDSNDDPDETTTQVDETKTFGTLSQAFKLAEELINDLGRPRTKPGRGLREAIENFRLYLDKQASPVATLNETAADLFQQIVDQVNEWRALKKGTPHLATQYHCDVIGFAMPQVTRLLSIMLQAFGSDSELTIEQMEPLMRAMTCASQLFKYADKLTEIHKFDGTQACIEAFDPFKVKQKVIAIFARIKTAKSRLTRLLEAARQAEATATNIQHKRADIQARADQEKAKAASSARLATLAETWQRLHLIRRYCEFPFKPPTFTERAMSIDPSRLKLLTHTNLPTARAEAALHAAEHKAWFTTSQASVALPWHGRAWTLTEDGYLTAALTAFGTADKPWDHVVQTTCQAKLTPRFEPGKLGRFTLADIVSRGVYLARRAMRADYLAARAMRPWTCVVDPRLDSDEGLKRMRWPVVRADSEEGTQRTSAKFTRPSVEGAAPTRVFKSLRRPNATLMGQENATPQPTVTRPPLAEVIAIVSDSEPDDLADLSESEPEAPSPTQRRI